MENWYKISQTELSTIDISDQELNEMAKKPWEPINSSFISEIAYYKAAGVLEVKLKSGRIYTFMGIPKNIYENFKKSPSKGKFFNEVIRKNFVSK